MDTAQLERQIRQLQNELALLRRRIEALEALLEEFAIQEPEPVVP